MRLLFEALTPRDGKSNTDSLSSDSRPSPSRSASRSVVAVDEERRDGFEVEVFFESGERDLFLASEASAAANGGDRIGGRSGKGAEPEAEEERVDEEAATRSVMLRIKKNEVEKKMRGKRARIES